MSILQNDTIIANEVFDSQLVNCTMEPDIKNKTQEENSYLDCINKSLGHSVKEKNLLKKQMKIDLEQKKLR